MTHELLAEITLCPFTATRGKRKHFQRRKHTKRISQLYRIASRYSIYKFF